MSVPKVLLDTPKAPAPPPITLPLTFGLIDATEPLTTEFGLGMAAFGRLVSPVQYYLKISLLHYGLPLDENVGEIAGTVPELVMIGMLLEEGFQETHRGFFDRTHMSFIFQSKLLGGRQPGGAVADIVSFYGGITTAGLVQSKYHALDNPFLSGGAKVEGDRVQHLKIAAEPQIDRVVLLNRPEEGSPLENGPLELMERDFLRLLGKA